jgi:DNA-binding MarR family transcriptional regulator
MSFVEAMNYFYYRTSVDELRWLNGGDYGGITYNSMLYLNVIAYTPDCTVTKLAKLVRITKPAVTIKVGELESRGFVTKERSARDKRVFYLRLSPAMRETYGSYDKLGAATELMLRRRYSEQEISLFARMLRDAAEFGMEEIENAG